jgi:hypothetical protein
MHLFASVISNDQLEDIQIYPNPTSGKINVSGSNINRIEVLSLEGEVIELREPDSSSMTLDFSAKTKGIYILRIATLTKVIFKKIVLN